MAPYEIENHVPKEIDLSLIDFGTFKDYQRYKLQMEATVEMWNLSPTPPFIVKKDADYLFSEARDREAFARRKLRYYETSELGEGKTKNNR